MAASCSTGSISQQTASSQSNAIVQWLGNSWSGGPGASYGMQWGVSVVTENSQVDGSSPYSSGSWNSVIGSLVADKVYKFRATVAGANGATKSKKTGAVVASASTPSSSAVTSTTATISCDYFPNVNESTSSAQLQYKKTTDPSWTNAGSPNTSGGYAEVTESEDLTGLEAATQYQVRLVITRTTATGTSLTSSTASFTTDAGVPTVTTDAASVVTNSSANLNATVTVNSGTGVEVYWMWGTTSGALDQTTSTQAVSSDGSFGVNISGLSASTTYYFQAFTSFTTPAGSPASGSELSFATAADPAAEAVDEEHMHIYEYDGVYGATKDLYFTLQSPAATSSDRLVTTAPGSLFASGDIKVSKDGGSFANAANSVSQIAASNPLYKLTLSTSEMSAEDVVVQIVDQDGPAFRDALIHVRSSIRTGHFEVNASNRTNTSGAVFTGSGSGHGISAVKGTTGRDIDGVLGNHVQRHNTAQAGGSTSIQLDTSASAANDFYNGAVVLIASGTGAGQARVITDYVGSTTTATVNKAWSTNPASGSEFVILTGDDPWKIAPGAELSALPTYASTYADMIQFFLQRFAYQREQTATTFTMRKADGSTSFATGAIDDDGSQQTHGALS